VWRRTFSPIPVLFTLSLINSQQILSLSLCYKRPTRGVSDPLQETLKRVWSQERCHACDYCILCNYCFLGNFFAGETLTLIRTWGETEGNIRHCYFMYII
jgi:hypothetical protein